MAAEHVSLETRSSYSTLGNASAAIGAQLAPYMQPAGAHGMFPRPALAVFDVHIVNGTQRSKTPRRIPLPDHLARYLFIFLMSSIVRYTPHQVDRCGDPGLKALLDLAVDEAKTTIVRDAAFFMASVYID